MSSPAQFKKDLQYGESYQEKLRDIFEYDTIYITQGYKKEYDGWFRKGKRVIYFEVKGDRFIIKTGNLCIEYESNGSPSGIAATTADVFVYFVDGENCFYYIPTNVLHRAIDERKFHWKANACENGKNKAYLFNRDLFEAYKIEIPSTANSVPIFYNDSYLVP
jgi:hypothetical protein